ncbi:MAG TPA: SCP2 sterol-binding domain-containing protein [Anaerolineales bacterium]|nr:SCP2 sterol-binding domain-containing protein [Anaerolineales bacterium]
MPTIFPSAEWLNTLQAKLNSDSHYTEVAKNWEGDILFDIEPAGPLPEPLLLYVDLWHGKCRAVEYAPDSSAHPKPTFVLHSPYTNFAAILLGKLDPMTAMLTTKLRVSGSLAYIMRNVPTVLDFVRCAREITTEIA